MPSGRPTAARTTGTVRCSTANDDPPDPGGTGWSQAPRYAPVVGTTGGVRGALAEAAGGWVVGAAVEDGAEVVGDG